MSGSNSNLGAEACVQKVNTELPLPDTKYTEIAGYSEKTFVEILLHRGIPPIKYSKLNLEKELRHA